MQEVHKYRIIAYEPISFLQTLIEKDDGTISIYGCSVDHPSCPPRDGYCYHVLIILVIILIASIRYVRGHAHLGGFVIRPLVSDPMRCTVEYLAWVDLKVSFAVEYPFVWFWFIFPRVSHGDFLLSSSLKQRHGCHSSHFLFTCNLFRETCLLLLPILLPASNHCAWPILLP